MFPFLPAAFQVVLLRCIAEVQPANFDPMPYVPLFAGSVSALVGLGVALVGLRTFLRSKASADWPTTEGQITRSEVVPDSEGHQRPAITYDYTVNGARHTGDQLRAGYKNLAGPANRAQAQVERFPVGTRVQVYYNPEKPAQSALEPGHDLPSMILLIIGGIIMLSSVFEYFFFSAVLKR